MSRGVSTAVDVVLAVLVVGGALTALASVDTRPPADRGTDAADGTATLLSTTTASVNYTLAPGIRDADDYVEEVEVTSGPALRRQAHGTVTGLLARAAVESAQVGGEPVTRTHEDFRASVADAVERTVACGNASVQVRATWRPYHGAPLAGEVVVGDAPPTEATVHAATTRAAAPVPATRNRARAVADEGYRAVARVVARGVVRGLYDPETAWIALRADRPTSTLATYRYRRTAELLETDVSGSLPEYDVESVNDRLVDALAERLAADMRERFDSPGAAAATVSTGTVVVTVRTWST